VRRALALVVGTLLLWTAAPAGANDNHNDDRDHQHRDRQGQVRLNQIQVLGTHNSYHVQAGPSLFSLLRSFSSTLADSLEYSHPPLDRQLGAERIRQVELDLFTDPAGGLYADPAGPRIVKQFGLPPDPPNDPTGVLRRPGLKVLHVQDIDFRSNCLTFVTCLRTIKQWSDDNPEHLPLMILVELKDDPIPDPGFGFVVPRKFGPADLDAVDREIRSVFSERQLLTPDDVRGRHATLEQAVLSRGWPRLDDARGKVLFTLDNEGRHKDLYLAGHPSLRGRVLFTSSRPGAPEAAFVKLNDPLVDGALIRDLVARGYIVRTRADADTVQARTGDTTQRDAALASGAQFVSTDYPVPNPAFGTGYFVAIPGGGPARCNPVNAPRNCPKRLERLDP
jgi:hypothetical protein